MEYKKNTGNRKTKKYVLFALLFVFCGILASGTKAEAAKTCSSVISLPAKTNAKVNIRKKAGTSYKSYGYVAKNDAVTILGQVKNNGATWYKCKAKVNGKLKTGYISSAYVKKTFPLSGTVNSKVTTHLNVRKKTSTTSKSLGKIKKNTKVTVKGITKKSSTYWYKISVKVKGKTVTGYVSGKYISVSAPDSQPAKTDTAPKSDDTATDNTVAKSGYVNDKVTTTLRVRKSASTSSEVLLNIKSGTKVSVIGTSGDWYKITVKSGTKNITGYVAKEYITLDSETGSNNTNNNTDNNTGTGETDAAFETLLKNFPASYQASLKTLHNAYPSWKFVAVDTGLDWNTVIANESIVGRNVMQSNYPKGGNTLAPFSYLSTASGAYDWSTDKYVVKDGSNWYSANSAVISYYMDPRNFLNDTDIFQFEALAYDSSQTVTVVQSILSNTFMKGKYSVKDSATGKTASGYYKDAFMDAGKGAKANPYFLATRVKQEVGINGSNSTSGTYKGYEGIYNFYNIGANDGGDAVAKGLSWAKGGSTNATTYGRPWTTPYKSIVGGAKYIAANYINKGQNTLYFQKFNVKPTETNQLYLHQYMTNVQAPYSEGRSTRTAYNGLGILKDAMVFYIPVYNNMPSSACKLPASGGNPNPFLSDLAVYNGNTKLSMSSTFKKPSSTGELSNDTYSVVVGKNVSTVKITASTISSKASVQGTGDVSLKPAGQTTQVKVTGVAQNGTKKEYIINITRNTK
ncbi:MAG: SH3 domain-containing protein [Clostridium sp.]|nr:SH3 domain-containing protein [Clostridium sp.]